MVGRSICLNLYQAGVSESANCPWTRLFGLNRVYVFDDSGLRCGAPGIRSLVQSGTKQISLPDDYTSQVGGSRTVLTGTEVENIIF